ncbi:uncharacterized protein LOC130690924 [Daphnia carinata]|uniref:uncharacterized protein LOC130690924 n=1 Tax=Daphnia carinata TaxID=120202 RepID=UPI00257CEEF6|nr:uncharacterized protein LOC130690924 [Daphnia carinata]
MLNASISIPDEVKRMSSLQDVNVVPTTNSTSSSGLVSVVVVCMTVMAVCALVYFAIRCYFDERRWRASALLCKCLPPPSTASLAECGNSCRYVERRAVNVAVQTGATEPAVSNRWSMSDVRLSEAKRISGCAFSSPLANNNEAIPNWRPPATGSSQRQSSHYYRLQKSSQRQKHRNHRQVQRQYYREAQQREEDDCHHYPLRRSRPVSMMPSIQIQSPSSSESYSILAMSTHSKSAAINKHYTPATFSGSDEESHHRNQYNKSGLSEGHSYGSTNPYHPRYNTPVSELNNDAESVVATADIEQAVAVVEPEEKGVADGEEEEAKPELMNHPLMDRVALDDRKWSKKSTSPRSVDDGEFTSAEPATGALTSATHVGMIPTTIQLVDEATQSCPSSVSGWYAGHLKRCQTSKTDSSCSLNVVSAGCVVPLDIARSALPLKGTFPSFEILPGTGGRLVNRRTQTDNASLASLDWDNYESERLRSEMDVEVYLDDFEGGDGYHRLTNVDEGVEGMTSSATLMASHVSADMTLQASRISQRSASSPYVLCFECSEDFSVNNERRSSAGFFFPRHTSSSSPVSRNANRRHQRLVAPPSPPNLLVSPQQPIPSGRHPQPDGQDGRSSKAVRPRRK